MLCVYITMALFCGTGWLWQALTRCCLLQLTMLGLMLHRIKSGDDIAFKQGWLLSISVNILIELSNYINMKAKVKLFIKV